MTDNRGIVILVKAYRGSELVDVAEFSAYRGERSARSAARAWRDHREADGMKTTSEERLDD